MWRCIFLMRPLVLLDFLRYLRVEDLHGQINKFTFTRTFGLVLYFCKLDCHLSCYSSISPSYENFRPRAMCCLYFNLYS